jgi:hypothetical protein
VLAWFNVSLVGGFAGPIITPQTLKLTTAAIKLSGPSAVVNAYARLCCAKLCL